MRTGMLNWVEYDIARNRRRTTGLDLADLVAEITVNEQPQFVIEETNLNLDVEVRQTRIKKRKKNRLLGLLSRHV